MYTIWQMLSECRRCFPSASAQASMMCLHFCRACASQKSFLVFSLMQRVHRQAEFWLFFTRLFLNHVRAKKQIKRKKSCAHCRCCPSSSASIDRQSFGFFHQIVPQPCAREKKKEHKTHFQCSPSCSASIDRQSFGYFSPDCAREKIGEKEEEKQIEKRKGKEG